MAAWHFERDHDWCLLDSGDGKTIAFVESRYAEYLRGGAPRRTVRFNKQDFKLDFSKMSIKLESGVICKLRRLEEGAVPKMRVEMAVETVDPKESIAPGSPGDPLRGLSIHYLSTTLLQDLARHGLSLETVTVRDIEPVFIRGRGVDAVCPRDGRLGAAFVDVVQGAENVGRATHMLSYTWSYRIEEIVASLVSWCERERHDPKQVFIWMCCFCINQHRVIEAQKAGTLVPFEEFRNEFESRVRGIGTVLALFGSWKVTLYVTRVWCVFELYSAMKLQALDPSKYHLELIMSPREAELFRQTLFTGQSLDAVWKALSCLKVEKADSFVESDRDRILALVRDGPGYAKVNLEIVNHLHAWFAVNSEGYLRQRLSAGSRPNGGLNKAEDLPLAHACVRVGDMLERVCKYESALELLQRGREIFEAAKAVETKEGAVLLRVQGVVLRRLGKLNEAMEELRRAERVHRVLGTDASTEFAQLLQDLGRIHGDRAELGAELKCHTRALEIRELEGTLETPEGASLFRSMGMVYFQRYEYKEALDFFEKSKAMHVKTDSLVTPEGAAALQSIADVMSSMHPPQFRKALTVHEEAYSIAEQLGIGRTARAVVQLRRMTFLTKSLGLKEQGLKLFQLVKSILKGIGGTEKPALVAETKAAEAAAPKPPDSVSGASASATEGAVASAGTLFTPSPSAPSAPMAPSAQFSNDMEAVTPVSPGGAIDSSWGIYFEVVNDSGFVDPSRRGFPHSLCSFETKGTCGLLPRHLQIQWGDTDALSVEGREWSLARDALEETKTLSLQQLRKVVRDGSIMGYLSPLHEVNLNDSAKERAGIPPEAKYFMFSYPVRIKVDGAIARAPRSADPDLAFLRNGGYVYLDDTMSNIVRMNAILPSSDGGLRFGPPLKWEADWSTRLINACRFRPITIDEISSSGATHFCWIRPNEVVSFADLDGSPICPLGGFAYICNKVGSATGVASGGEASRGLKRSFSQLTQ